MDLQSGAEVGLQLRVCKTEFILALLFINDCIIFPTNNCKPTFQSSLSPHLTSKDALLPEALVCSKVVADGLVERDLTNTGEYYNHSISCLLYTSDAADDC